MKGFWRKYKGFMPSLMFTGLIVLIRIVYTGSIYFGWILLNLLLAMIPLVFSYLVYKNIGRRIAWLYAGLWLLFFPNAMYIITDLIHLHDQRNFPGWYDLLILFTAAINGLAMGLMSLSEIDKWLAKVVRRTYRYPVLFGLFLLCGYGIYLGRYLRWNSWDIVTRPFALLQAIAGDVLHPFRNIECWMLTLFFGVWLYLFYRYAGKLRLSLNEDNMVARENGHK